MPSAEPWPIQWYKCTADPDDVKFAKSEGRRIKVGDELWRVPRAIGPIEMDHNHWAGEHFTGEPEDWALAALAPVLAHLVRQYVDPTDIPEEFKPVVAALANDDKEALIACSQKSDS